MRLVAGWRFWVDRGGTFTDLVACPPQGPLIVRKVLSQQPGWAGDPTVAAIRELLGLGDGAPIPPGWIEEVRLGTTVATNALLERSGSPTLLLVNRGFAEALLIGDQHRPDLFALQPKRPDPLYRQVLVVNGRLGADGLEIEPLRLDDDLAASVQAAWESGCRSCAVVLLHATRQPLHEIHLGQWLKSFGFDQVMLSHQVSPSPRFVPRGHTALVEAFVGPPLANYLDQVGSALGTGSKGRESSSPSGQGAKAEAISGHDSATNDSPLPGSAPRLRVMQSSGGLIEPAQLLAKDTILSGPAGGLVGALGTAAGAGLAGEALLGFDMGGTSTDVFHLPAGRPGDVFIPERRQQAEVAGFPLLAPMVAIHTVAAGGGSVIQFDGERLRVGPTSAGADPGPAAYRRGGPATLTDANLVLGRLQPQFFPRVFGPQRDQPLDPDAARRVLSELADRITAATGRPHSPEQVALGAIAIATARMAEAIKRVSVQKGHAIGAAVLCGYGGASGQHVCGLAEALGLWRVLLHPMAGVLSALGMGLADERLLRERVLELPLESSDGASNAILAALDSLRAEAHTAFATKGSSDTPLQEQITAHLCTLGSDVSLPVPWGTATSMATAFGELHERRYGYPPQQPLRLERLTLELVRPAPPLDLGPPQTLEPTQTPGPPQTLKPSLLPEPPLDPQARNRQEQNRQTLDGQALERQAQDRPNQDRQPSSAAAHSQGAPVAAAPGAHAAQDPETDPETHSQPPTQTATATIAMHGLDGWQSVPLWQRDRLKRGQRLAGPALIVEETGTIVLAAGWSATVLPAGELLLDRPFPATFGSSSTASGSIPAASNAWPGAAASSPAVPPSFPCVPSIPTSKPAAQGSSPKASASSPSASACSPSPRPPRSTDPAAAGMASTAAQGESAAAGVDPVRLELFQHRFTAIAEQMGERLRQTASSVNIKERLDFSCALFDGRGALVANAPHIPVHLGSMGDSVVSLLAAVARGERLPLRPGDAIAANNPYNGGTHLPDITVITPVFAAESAAADGEEWAEPLFFVACRGHHGDVGGLTPGSMPPFSRHIAEEGLLLDNVTLLSDGLFDEAAWRSRMAAGPHPVRDPDRLLADLQAQLAANRLGADALEALVQREGDGEVVRYMGHGQAQAAAAVRRVIDRLREGAHRMGLDDGSQLQVKVTLDRTRRRARLDFTGTSEQQAGNRNAPLAITKAVVLYVFRTLVEDEIPLNAGCFEPLDLVVPPGCLLHPRPPAAVVAGNVETSQALANLLFASLGVMASAQGTMNNLSFGNDHCQYYETLGGGTGAGSFNQTGFDGADAIQSHMTNSRLTDPEILEARYPVRLESFGISHGSGGAGRWSGGDGLIRQIQFLEPLTVSLISDQRQRGPQGLAGGEDGAPGRNLLKRSDGDWELLPGCFELSLAAGDRLRLETPGGGGYGAPCGPPPSEAG